MEQSDVQQIARPSMKVAELKRTSGFLLCFLNVRRVDNVISPRYPEKERLLTS